MTDDETTAEWPHWTEVRREWNQCSPHDVQLLEYDSDLCPEVHEPWWRVPEGLPLRGGGPLDDTAAHLMRLGQIPGSDEAVAFKLLAFCRQERQWEFQRAVVEPVLRPTGVDPGRVWYTSARYVLPPPPHFFCESPHGPVAPEDSLSLVRMAARCWHVIAERYAILLVPHLANTIWDFER